MKIESIIIEKEADTCTLLKKCLASRFPEIAVSGEASNCSQASELLKNVSPGLVFSDIDILNRMRGTHKTFPFEFVYMSGHSEDAITALQQDACGFIMKPINVGDVVTAVGCAIRKLAGRNLPRAAGATPLEMGSLPHTKLVGIPTVEGIEFLYVHEIIRCEGLQKCTRIVTLRKNTLVSAYNIGEFRKMLEQYGFFACHKSHLINLMHVSKYTREGFVFLSDRAAVPLARRKRIEFLQNLRHL